MTDKGLNNFIERMWDGIFYIGLVLDLAAISFGLIHYLQRR